MAKAPLIEAEERDRLGDEAFDSAGVLDPAIASSHRVMRTDSAGQNTFVYQDTVVGSDLESATRSFFDGPDLSDLFSDSANKADLRRGRLERCRAVLEKLEGAGALKHGEAELRLVMAATAGDVERVEELLAAGADADGRGTDGRTAIESAASGGHLEIVDRLLKAGCDVDARRPGRPSALELGGAPGRSDDDSQLARCRGQRSHVGFVFDRVPWRQPRPPEGLRSWR